MMLVLIISLLLHGVTILWIFTLMKRLELMNVSRNEMDQAKREIEDLLLSYTAEMKDENERLMNQLQLAKSDEVPREENQASLPVIKKDEKETLSDYQDYSPPTLEHDEEVSYVQSVESEVLSLANQGLTTEQIAKKMDIGTGEVELMLKFNSIQTKSNDF